jgi:hypothetical protein
MARSRFEVLVIGGESGSADALLRVLLALAPVPEVPLLATLVEDTRARARRPMACGFVRPATP